MRQFRGNVLARHHQIRIDDQAARRADQIRKKRMRRIAEVKAWSSATVDDSASPADIVRYRNSRTLSA